MLPLIDAGLRALTRADAAELQRLVEAAQKARAPEGAVERALLLRQMRVFGHLLGLTRRNLQLLHAGCGRPQSYSEN